MVRILSKTTIKKFELFIINNQLTAVLHVIYLVTFPVIIILFFQNKNYDTSSNFNMLRFLKSNYLNYPVFGDISIYSDYIENTLKEINSNKLYPHCSILGKGLYKPFFIQDIKCAQHNSYTCAEDKYSFTNNSSNKQSFFAGLFSYYQSTYFAYYFLKNSNSIEIDVDNFKEITKWDKSIQTNLVLFNISCKFNSSDNMEYFTLMLLIEKQSNNNNYTFRNDIVVINDYSWNKSLLELIVIIVFLISTILYLLNLTYLFNAIPKFSGFLCILITICDFTLIIFIIIYSINCEMSICSKSIMNLNEYIDLFTLINLKFIIKILSCFSIIFYPNRLFEIISLIQRKDKSSFPNQIVSYLNSIYRIGYSLIFTFGLFVFIQFFLSLICFLIFSEEIEFHSYLSSAYNLFSISFLKLTFITISRNYSYNNYTYSEISFIVIIFIVSLLTYIILFSTVYYLLDKSYYLENKEDNPILTILSNISTTKIRLLKEENITNIDDTITNKIVILFINFDNNFSSFYKITEEFKNDIKTYYYSKVKFMLFFLRIIFKIKPKIKHSNTLLFNYLIIIECEDLISEDSLENLSILMNYIKFHHLNLQIVIIYNKELDNFTKLHLNQCFNNLKLLKVYEDLVQLITDKIKENKKVFRNRLKIMKTIRIRKSTANLKGDRIEN